MTVLSDHDITLARGRGLGIDPYHARHLQPASYDVHLDAALLLLREADGLPLDTKADTGGEFVPVRIDAHTGFTLTAGAFALGSTTERLTLPTHLGAQLQGKSSLGRLGLMVHSTAGYIDPGFHGHITLELMVAHARGVVLYPGMPIGQIAFTRVEHVAGAYTGKYNGQSGPTPSRFHLNWDGAAWR